MLVYSEVKPDRGWPVFGDDRRAGADDDARDDR
jgi:hypothetical protein